MATMCVGCGRPLYDITINLRSIIPGKSHHEKFNNADQKTQTTIVEYFELLNISLCCRSTIMNVIVPSELVKQPRVSIN